MTFECFRMPISCFYIKTWKQSKQILRLTGNGDIQTFTTPSIDFNVVVFGELSKKLLLNPFVIRKQ